MKGQLLLGARAIEARAGVERARGRECVSLIHGGLTPGLMCVKEGTPLARGRGRGPPAPIVVHESFGLIIETNGGRGGRGESGARATERKEGWGRRAHVPEHEGGSVVNPGHQLYRVQGVGQTASLRGYQRGQTKSVAHEHPRSTGEGQRATG